MTLLRSAIFGSLVAVRQTCRRRRAPWLEAVNGWQRTSSAHLHHSTFRLAVADPAPNDPTEQRSPPSDKILRLVDEISSLTLLEVSDMTQLLRKRLGMPDMPMGMPMMGGMMPMMSPVGMPGQQAAAPAEEKKEEKTQFDVKLEKFDAASKLKVIKEVRAITALGLKESKEMVEQSPVVIKKGVSKEEADAILEKLKAVGASCVLE